VRIYNGEADAPVAARHAKRLADQIPGSRWRLYPDEGHFSIDRGIKEIFESPLAP
jgi:pimeloyl-ACP methyl ester carboxylesterase